MTEFTFFEIEKDGNTAVLYMNRPEKMNAMNWAFWDDLPNVVAEIEADDDIHSVVVAGKGKVFSIGLDVFDMVERFGSAMSGRRCVAEPGRHGWIASGVVRG